MIPMFAPFSKADEIVNLLIMSEAKRQRATNWRSEEEVCLMEAFGQRRSVLEASFSSRITNADKNQAWEEISAYVSR